jgi:hypothetical protein
LECGDSFAAITGGNHLPPTQQTTLDFDTPGRSEEIGALKAANKSPHSKALRASWP